MQTLSSEMHWTRGAVGYEVYIRSFMDSNGDGIGDLPGITAKLDYLVELGVDVVWITPFFPSPGHDHGYDVSDYCDVDPQFGTLRDFDELVAQAQSRGLRIFVDIVPNHTSSAHQWFQAAIADVDSPYRDYYHFRDGGPDGGPPNNWVSHFGGSAWTADPAGTGKYYLHLFLHEQPDLNWSNPAVLNEFESILTFWCERGVDGFRIDVAHGLMKDAQFRNNPQLRPVTPEMHPTDVFMSFDHLYDLHQAETAGVFREWRRCVAPYGAVLLGEMDTRNIYRFSEYVSRRDGLDFGFVLKIGLTDWAPNQQIDDLLQYLLAANGGAAWEVSNHDQARAVSRFATDPGGTETGLRRTMALTTAMVALDGMTFIYQGEELGLPDSIILGDAEDPLSARNGGGWGRDVARGGIPWNSSVNNGFTAAAQAWMPTAEVPRELTAEFQVTQPGSTWSRYRDMLTIRKRLHEDFAQPLQIRLRTESALVVQRGRVTVLANFGAEPLYYSLAPFTIEYESCRGAAHAAANGLAVQPESTVVVRRHL